MWIGRDPPAMAPKRRNDGAATGADDDVTAGAGNGTNDGADSGADNGADNGADDGADNGLAQALRWHI